MSLTIIGSGPGGYVAALKASQLGAKVNVIECDEVGGTCLNWGCIPTKAILASAEALQNAKNLEDFGIDLSGKVSPNLSKIMERKRKIVSTQVKGIRALFKSRGVNLIEGKAVLLSPHKIEIRKRDGSSEIIDSEKIIIATGSRPAQLPLMPFDGENILSSTDALNIKTIPQSLLIIGAGVVGSEFAFIFSELGADVTLLEMMPRAIPTEDYEISEILQKELKKKKIKLLTGIKVERVDVKRDGIHVHLQNGKEVIGEKLLISVGRNFNTEGIGLEAAEVKTGKRGEIIVNEKMETNVPDIYAIGDVVGGALLAHKASEDGVVAAYNACGIERKIDYSVIPAAIFTTPEIGSVGLRQHQAEEKGIAIKTGRSQFRALGKAHAIGKIAGMFKIIADAKTDKILGVHIIGANASDLIHEGALAIKAGLTVSEVAEMIHAHPTLSEGFREAAWDVHGKAIHASVRDEKALSK